ncbi:acyl-CoA dehydrogenase [Mycolicibacterium moriokaense]|jgi:alkylation response protein AidB-like acyl-CoA dehydrogenase|uniref:Acyl-CoA dehydrogenase n=1 Tax=Mycolicibacterium moriokaense TaxID=39691 RepID=A0AAD1H9P1_9MYCO|nr:acyl-CoA dehydrogenase family protein [Mycolicibacterium moriokaense]MCV7041048.1 acyl-CoA/acyl-ACP dehydrogenase [Mycolicibacterium moriokaense]ORB27329.1 acyl-CoA dehydrogenase [Mycolicibacterium moriokaense]BBX00609.1 acyl-CoA dehydrogenase [Mycolicibacterium moriokaense]
MSEFAEFHAELRSVAGDLLAKDRTVEWPALVDAGWVGLEIPEQFGGAGATFAETAVICEEIGRAASATSYLGSAVLAVGTLNALQPSDVRDQLLTDIASGGVRTAVALDGTDFVPDADGADQVLVVAENGVTVGTHTATPTPVVDETRRLAAVTPTGGETLLFDGDPSTAIQGLRDRAAVAVACDSLGVSEAMLAATVGYAKVRHQFGRPIGSFQAVKHACADMLVSITVSRQLVTAAVQAIAENQDAKVAAAMAKSHACGAAVDIAGKAMQLHGGIGYTWESGIHVYLKRAALNRSLFGSPAAHRRELAKRYR